MLWFRFKDAMKTLSYALTVIIMFLEHLSVFVADLDLIILIRRKRLGVKKALRRK